MCPIMAGFLHPAAVSPPRLCLASFSGFSNRMLTACVRLSLNCRRSPASSGALGGSKGRKQVYKHPPA